MENAPMFDINKWFLMTVGLWPLQSAFKRYSVQAIQLFINVTCLLAEVFAMLAVWTVNKTGVLKCISPMAAIVISFTINAHEFKFYKIKRVVGVMKEDYAYLMNIPENVIFRNYLTEGRKMTIYYAVYCYSTLFVYQCLPMAPVVLDIIMPLNETRVKKYIVEVNYGIDNDQYFLAVSLHSVACSITVVTLIIANDILYITCVQHSCALFSIVSYQLQTVHVSDVESFIDLKDESRIARNTCEVYTLEQKRKIYRKMQRCIQFHTHALHYVHLVESLFAPALFVQLAVNTACLAITGIEIVLNADSLAEIIRIAMFACAQFTRLFIMCFPGQQLINHCEQVYRAALESMWYTFSKQCTSLYKILLVRSLRTSKVTALGLVPMTMQTFLSISHTAMSYFTLLLSVV